MRTTSVAITLPLRSRGSRIAESSGTARTQRTRARACFHDPVVARDSRVQSSGFDVAGHFLSTHHQTFDFRVIDGWDVASGAQSDLPACTSEKIECRLLQAAFWDSQL